MEIKALDSYTVKARYYPTMIVVAPMCLVVLSLASGQLDLLKSIGVGIVSGLGLVFVMDQVGRDSGRNKQSHLFRQWGGVPTTVLLRHQDHTIGGPTKERYHCILSKLLPDLDIPSAQQEMENQSRADEVYASCTEFLKEATRDSAKFPLIFQENSNYGFRRNLWVMKAGGLVVSAIGTVICGAICVYRLRQPSEMWLVPAVSALLSVLLLYLWACRFTPSWVRMTAFAYARQLLAACDSPHIHNRE